MTKEFIHSLLKVQSASGSGCQQRDWGGDKNPGAEENILKDILYKQTLGLSDLSSVTRIQGYVSNQ